MHRARNATRLQLRRRALAAARYDINVFLEDLSPGFFAYARVNLFIPNPEWFKRNQARYLNRVDAVLCKTQDAVDTFSGMGSSVKFIGFTSDDRYAAGHDTNLNNGFLHVAGRSWQKGTRALTTLWQKHPEWPMLTVVQNAKTYSQSSVQAIHAPNIRHILERLDDDALRELQNRHAIHLCPSEAEGFGHCIAEAMSCGALTLTTDAPPMNELITPDRGILVNYHRAQKQRCGANYYVDPIDLERKIVQIIAMDEPAIRAAGANARQWFLANDQQFRERLKSVLDEFFPVDAGRY
jgi:glycosyltransferase involved in cell wall biosynthesis